MSPSIANTDPRATLALVADILPAGTARMVFGRLFFCGQEALFVGPSGQLVLAAVWDGFTLAQRAENVKRGTPAEDIAADIIARIGQKVA